MKKHQFPELLSLSLPRSNHSVHLQQFTLVFAFSISKYVCSGFSWFIHSRHVLIFSSGRWSVISALLAHLSSTNLPNRWLKSLFRAFTIRTGNVSCSSKLSAVVAFFFLQTFLVLFLLVSKIYTQMFNLCLYLPLLPEIFEKGLMI